MPNRKPEPRWLPDLPCRRSTLQQWDGAGEGVGAQGEGGRPTGPCREGICSLPGLVSTIPGGPAVARAWGQSGCPPRTRTGALNQDAVSQVPSPAQQGVPSPSSTLTVTLGWPKSSLKRFHRIMDQLVGQASTCLARLRIGSTNRSLAQNRLWVTRSRFRDHHCFVVCRQLSRLGLG